MIFLLFFGASFMVAAAEFRAIAFRSCGGDVTHVRVQPCTHEPCSIKRGETVLIEVPFRANQDSDKLASKISAQLGDLELPLPSLKKDGCREQGIRCPLEKNEKYVFRYQLETKPFYPKLNTTAKLSLTGAKGVVFCVTFPVNLTD
ncbi:mite group 2 allergen Tyr p 2-like [Ixodes scapularis]|uniref:mite group 2 allergen Tyr p 2-like n=1 Tax=Ixodes scapularis TaxID=6945 RepID=UPI001A9DFE46|nr:mite group 2 allergen Tyr p 2-like [Ixodes scapularis]